MSLGAFPLVRRCGGGKDGPRYSSLCNVDNCNGKLREFLSIGQICDAKIVALLISFPIRVCNRQAVSAKRKCRVEKVA